MKLRDDFRVRGRTLFRAIKVDAPFAGTFASQSYKSEAFGGVDASAASLRNQKLFPIVLCDDSPHRSGELLGTRLTLHPPTLCPAGPVRAR